MTPSSISESCHEIACLVSSADMRGPYDYVQTSPRASRGRTAPQAPELLDLTIAHRRAIGGGLRRGRDSYSLRAASHTRS